MFMLPGSHYSDPEFSWKFAVPPAGIGFLSSRALGPQYPTTCSSVAATPNTNGRLPVPLQPDRQPGQDRRRRPAPRGPRRGQQRQERHHREREPAVRQWLRRRDGCRDQPERHPVRGVPRRATSTRSSESRRRPIARDAVARKPASRPPDPSRRPPPPPNRESRATVSPIAIAAAAPTARVSVATAMPEGGGDTDRAELGAALGVDDDRAAAGEDEREGGERLGETTPGERRPSQATR